MYSLLESNGIHPLAEDMTNMRIVMLGEATHGTHEYYTWRMKISKSLIVDKGFRFIAVEGDWPACYHLNRYVKGYEDAGKDGRVALGNFDRWPAWMWANWEIAALAEWLREYNSYLPADERVGFYGLDVYSLWDSIKVIVDFFSGKDQQAVERAKRAVNCFEPLNENERLYARYSLIGHDCEQEVIDLLRETRAKIPFQDGEPETGLNMGQNAWIAVNAEKYYRSLLKFDNESWNIRDLHMMDTLERLLNFHGKLSRGIVWAHNTHIGDARATDMKSAGMINIGQLARERLGEDKVYLCGFASHRGSVIAGKQWGTTPEKMVLPPARSGSVEAHLHGTEGRNGYLLLKEEEDPLYKLPIGHRAVGVVYNPDNERNGNYVPSVLRNRYNAFVYLDKTSALHPLKINAQHQAMPDTYPFGL